VYSYFESRGGKFPAVTFFGLQYLLRKHLEGQVVTREKIDEAEEIVNAHFGMPGLFNRKGWEHILKEHGGRLPVRIRAVPEGTTVPVSNVLMTIENTDKKCYWLPNYLETLLVQAWYPTTVATLSRNLKLRIGEYMDMTGTRNGLEFKLHDFGFRGVSSTESAAIGGAAHLVNFRGTDTVSGLLLLRRYYGANMAGFSIPAAEHSTITSWGGPLQERAAMQNMLEQFPKGLVAVVSDSYDIFRACKEIWGGDLKSRVLERDGTVVVRPDSGDPQEVVLKVLDILGERFGTTKNEKGYKVLPPQLRVIQGDGVNYDSVQGILAAMEANGWSAENIAFGMGGALLQKLDRDTQKFAFKCSNITVDGIDCPVYKKPVTDPGKNSKAGRLRLLMRSYDDCRTVEENSQDARGREDGLFEVFRDGKVLKTYTLDEVRANAQRIDRAREVLRPMLRENLAVHGWRDYAVGASAQPIEPLKVYSPPSIEATNGDWEGQQNDPEKRGPLVHKRNNRQLRG
jgi:nicotinamide phosphoribosyltransferase